MTRTGTIERVRTPVSLDVLDLWLCYAHAPLDWLTNWLQDRGRVGLSWWAAWACDAYTQVWLRWLFSKQDSHLIEVDYDMLSPETRARAETRAEAEAGEMAEAGGDPA